MKLCIFRTNNGRGWGLKAGERIERGAFLTTYLGEVITSEEAAIRDDNYGEIINIEYFDVCIFFLFYFIFFSRKFVAIKFFSTFLVVHR